MGSGLVKFKKSKSNPRQNEILDPVETETLISKKKSTTLSTGTEVTATITVSCTSRENFPRKPREIWMSTPDVTRSEAEFDGKSTLSSDTFVTTSILQKRLAVNEQRRSESNSTLYSDTSSAVDVKQAPVQETVEVSRKKFLESCLKDISKDLYNGDDLKVNEKELLNDLQMINSMNPKGTSAPVLNVPNASSTSALLAAPEKGTCTTVVESLASCSGSKLDDVKAQAAKTEKMKKVWPPVLPFSPISTPPPIHPPRSAIG